VSASAPLAVISAVGLSAAWSLLGSRSLGASRRLLVIAVVSVGTGLVLLAAVGVLWSQRGPGVVSVRALGPILVFGAAVVVGLVLSFVAGRSGTRWLVLVTVVITVLVSASALARVTSVFGQVEASPERVAAFDLAAAAPAAPAASGDAAAVAAPAAVPMGAGEEWSSLEVDAASFLAAHTVVADVIVTNRPISSLVPALAARKMFIAGTAYQTLYGRPGDVALIQPRMAISQRFAESPGVADFAALCSSGVTWGWMSRTGGPMAESWEPYATVQFTNDAVTIIQLDRSRC